ncbi:hypothetical protein U1Q18_019875 [Sarracenia purpurea var. burkii]
MSEDMNLSVNGQSQVPPGFRFHPTEEELLHYYLRKKVASKKIDLDVIRDVDLNKLEPWDIQDKCKIGSTPQNDWLDDSIHDASSHNPTAETVPEEGWVVCRVFRKKNYHKALESPQKSSSTSMELIRTQMRNSSNDGILDQILQYMGRSSCKQESETIADLSANCDANMLYLPAINTSIHELQQRFTHLPRLESAAPTLPSPNNNSPLNEDDDRSFRARGQEMDDVDQGGGSNTNAVDGGHNDWVALDRLVASQLNGEQDEDDFCFSMDHQDVQLSHVRPNREEISIQPSRVYSNEMDWWSFTRSSSSSSSDPLSHLSV